MKIKELMTLCEGFHPDDTLALWNGHRYMQIIGYSPEKTSESGTPVLEVDWAVDDKPVESPRDILERQRERIEKAIASLEVQEDKRMAAPSTNGKRKRRKKKKTVESVMAEGVIRTGQRGRPRKIVTEEELIAKQNEVKRPRGRPKKEPVLQEKDE